MRQRATVSMCEQRAACQLAHASAHMWTWQWVLALWVNSDMMHVLCACRTPSREWVGKGRVWLFSRKSIKSRQYFAAENRGLTLSRARSTLACVCLWKKNGTSPIKKKKALGGEVQPYGTGGVIFIPVPLVMIHKFHRAPCKSDRSNEAPPLRRGGTWNVWDVFF